MFFLELLSAVEPRVVNWSLVTKGETGMHCFNIIKYVLDHNVMWHTGTWLMNWSSCQGAHFVPIENIRMGWDLGSLCQISQILQRKKITKVPLCCFEPIFNAQWIILVCGIGFTEEAKNFIQLTLFQVINATEQMYHFIVIDIAEEDKKLNATYIISVARKLGCSIFLLPEDVIEVIVDLNNPLYESFLISNYWWFAISCVCYLLWLWLDQHVLGLHEVM